MWIFGDDIYLLQLGFLPVAAVGRLADRQIYTTGETIQKNRTHTIENKHTKQEKHKKNIKKHKSSNYKITKRSK